MSFPQYPEIQTKNSVRTDKYIEQLMTDKYIPELARTITQERANIQKGKSFSVFLDGEKTDINESLCNKMDDFLKTQGYKFKTTYHVSLRGWEYCSFK